AREHRDVLLGDLLAAPLADLLDALDLDALAAQVGRDAGFAAGADLTLDDLPGLVLAGPGVVVLLGRFLCCRFLGNRRHDRSPYSLVTPSTSSSDVRPRFTFESPDCRRSLIPSR